MLDFNMNHQNPCNNNSVGTSHTHKINDFIHIKIDLLVTQKINNISKKTSNPKRVSKLLKRYVGLQLHQQIEIGRLR